MKDEIENILGNINFEVETEQEWLEPLGLDRNTWKQILDYITNLQTIEQQYSAILSENAELENKITNLQKENERLKRLAGKDYTELNIVEMKATIYKSRIDKAIEYIKNNTYFKDNKVKTMIFKDFSNDLLIILGDKENE